MYDGLRFTVPDWEHHHLQLIGVFAEEHRDELTRCAKVGEFPRELYAEMGRRGWVGPFVDPALGGLGGGVAEYCAIEEEVARHALVSPQIAIQGQRWLVDWGTPEQRDRYLGPLARGESIFSESISEPGVGSSLKSMQTTARRDGDDFILNGAKTHVNMGHQSDVTLVYATGEEGMTAFLVDMDLPGVNSRQTDPIGLRLIPTADMLFEDVRVPSSAVLGNVGRAMDTFLSTFNVSRIGNASELIGFGRRALAQGITYAESRRVGDQNVTSFQGIQWTIADCYADLYAASLARNQAANLVDAGAEHALATSLAKKLAIDAAERATGEVFALVGGHGLYYDTDYAQLLNDTKVMRIAGGSLEILRNYIARRVIGSANREGLA